MIAFALVSGAFAACGSPDVTIGPVGLDGGDEAAAADVDVDADVTTDASVSDSQVVSDAPGDDAATATRDAAKLEAGAPCPGVNPCDCDNDGYKSKADACAGDDCDDLDSLRHPNQTYVAEPPTPPSDGNWDCVAPIEKQYAVNLKCAALLTCNTSAEGFTNDPACGEEADYFHCQGGALGCTAVKVTSGNGKRRQGCK